MLADKLRGERERKGLSINDVASATSIRALYIEGLESGDYSKLPAEVYIKGFIRNYASYLGLDPKEMMKEYLSENHPDKLAEVEASEEAAQKMEEDRKEHKEDLFHETLAVASVSDDAEEISSSDLLNPPAHRHRRLNILVAGIILILVIAGAGYLLADSGPDSQQGTASKSAAQQDNAKEAQAAQTAEQENSQNRRSMASKFLQNSMSAAGCRSKWTERSSSPVSLKRDRRGSIREATRFPLRLATQVPSAIR